MMKPRLTAIGVLLFVCLGSASARVQDLLPAPVSCELRTGEYTGQLKVIERGPGKELRRVAAALPDFARREAYRIDIRGRRIRLEAFSEEGFFRARTTLEQILDGSGSIPCCTITDYPRFAHRGLMIDESRSFKGAAFLKKQMDAMVMLKLNVLHLHLTDSAGWRIEVPGYPALTDSAAWRPYRSYFDWERAGYPFCNASTPGAYGGYYTADELKELVAYAAQRHITIIPEIEMPGHSMDVNRMYPELACVDSTGASRNFAWDLCPGNEGTFELLKAALDQVMDIFPSKLIHIGGDEASMKAWHDCERCRERMQEEGFGEVHELQGYLMRRVENYLLAHGRRAIGWDEIIDSALSREAVVQSWRGSEGGIKASAAGHDVILSPNTHCYFDYYQDLIRKEPPAGGPLVSLRFCYGYEPLSPDMDASHILGIQANLWCEFIPSTGHAEYMLYPRLFAIAETAWSPAGCKDFTDFRRRAGQLVEDFRARGYNTFDLSTESELARSGYQTFEQFKATFGREVSDRYTR